VAIKFSEVNKEETPTTKSANINKSTPTGDKLISAVLSGG
jgi:hypothetical protein